MLVGYLDGVVIESETMSVDNGMPRTVQRTTANDRQARTLLRDLFDAAVNSASPEKVLPAYLPTPPSGRCIVVGAGKAAGSMALAVEKAWPTVKLSGVVVVPYGSAEKCQRIRVLEAAHPVPDENSVAAARQIIAAVSNLSNQDLVLALISGGGSATMCLPIHPITLADKQVTNRLLLSSGLDIRTMNAVRRRLSAIKGGKLAAAAQPASVVTLAISDIPGDNPAAIASGPTICDPGADLDWAKIVATLGPGLPQSVVRIIGTQPQEPTRATTSTVSLISRPMAALQAAADLAHARGIDVVILGDAIEGESATVARKMVRDLPDVSRPTVFISGGETTVNISGSGGGRGGRNTEFALALACELDGRTGLWALAADTDGEDGANLGAAGAIVSPDSLGRAKARGLDPADYLARHDSGTFFEHLNDLVVTGPTRTNVNDFRVLLVFPADQDHALSGE